MMSRRGLAIGLLGMVSACAAQAQQRASFSGVYAEGFEMMAFMPDSEGPRSGESAERWWVEFAGDTYADIQAAKPASLPPHGAFWIRVEFEGELSGQGEFGHLGAYARILRVTRVVSTRNAAPIPPPYRLE
jgi:hypothetical protein